MIINKVMNNYFENAGYDKGIVRGLEQALAENEVINHLQGIWTNKNGNTVYTFKCWPEDDDITRINLVVEDVDGEESLEDWYIQK